ncbi:MAG TPA: sugar ABC transporter permease [Caldilineae bacterium]|nr:sugar ABC transporter permease [Caldilineae bacterium]
MAFIPIGRWSRVERQNFVKGILFASPWILGFLGWTIYPILASLYYSFTRFDAVRPPVFIGLANYIDMVAKDEVFRVVLYNTVYFVLLGVPAGLVTAFMLAVLLNNEMKWRPVFRTIFFLPAIVPAIASAEVWRWVYNPQFGLINATLKSMGMSTIPWLSSPTLAKPSLIIIHMWAQGTAMVIFLAALQDVPRSLYDAALVDGANRWQRFWHVTIPMTTPAILFVMLTSLIGMFQYFTLGWLLTQGAPNNSTEFYSMYLYRNAFVYFKMGYASALAWLLFLIIVAFTVLIFRTSAQWVYYGGEG